MMLFRRRSRDVSRLMVSSCRVLSRRCGLLGELRLVGQWVARRRGIAVVVGGDLVIDLMGSGKSAYLSLVYHIRRCAFLED